MRQLLGPEGWVDVVLNSLTDAYIPYSLALLKPAGHFIEIGKRGIWTAEEVHRERPDAHYETIQWAPLRF